MAHESGAVFPHHQQQHQQHQQHQQQHQHQPSASTLAADATADVTPLALREELRDLDAEMSSLHQSLYDAAASFGATLPRSELGAVPAARDVFLP